MKIFRKRPTQQEKTQTADTRPTLPSGRKAGFPSLLAQVPPGLTVAKTSHIGRIRERNEDSFVTVDCTCYSNSEAFPLGLYIIADGMGGHKKGEIASALAAQVVANHIVQDVFIPFLCNQQQSSQSRPINEALVNAVEAANLAVYQDTPEGGTTLTVALILRHKVYLAHVGDSRAYVLTKGTLRQLTQDHSLVARLADIGEGTPEEALAHTNRNILYRAVGQTDSVEVDTCSLDLPAGSCILLCSDGLWDKVPGDEMLDTLMSAASPQAAIDRLVTMANRNGGDDNITAILVTRAAHS